MGTVLQQRGLSPQGRPELLNLTEPELLDSVYKEYIAAGSQVIYANTFGANGLKLAKTGHSVEEVVGAAIAVAKRAAAGTGTLVALDVGPLGELLEPMGTLSFERAYDLVPRNGGSWCKGRRGLNRGGNHDRPVRGQGCPAGRPRRPPTCRCLSPCPLMPAAGPSPAVRSPPWPVHWRAWVRTLLD